MKLQVPTPGRRTIITMGHVDMYLFVPLTPDDRTQIDGGNEDR